MSSTPTSREISSPIGHRSAGPLSARRPDLARDWHPTLNFPRTLDEFSGNSPFRAWWQCPHNPQHQWQASIKSRYSKRTGCRRCNLSMRAHQHSLATERLLSRRSPEIAATWHPELNHPLTPDQVTFSSRYRAWWQCSRQPHHVWDTTVNNRQHSGCPFCAGQRVRMTGARHRYQAPLSQTHPEIAREWHPTRNLPFHPHEVTAGSVRLVWWQCPRNDEHVYVMTIHMRSSNHISCPACRKTQRAGRRPARGNAGPRN